VEFAYALSPHWHWQWIVPLLFMILMFVFAIRMCRRMDAWQGGVGLRGRGRCGCWVPGHGPAAHDPSDAPIRILDRRYASGEITHERYEQMRRELESSASNTGSGGDS